MATPDINKAYSWAIQTCNADKVGYSQTYRNQQTVNGITYYDCSSFINYALLAGGFETPSYVPSHNAFTTGTEINELLRLGFTEVSATGEYLAGDIGWKTGHTEMCYQGGQGKGIFMGAHTSNASLANQVSIGSSTGDATYERSFTRLFRYGSGGASGYGVSIYVASALAGNAWQESTINPSLTQIGGNAFGIFQWDGGRKTDLLQWLSDNGYDSTDPVGQMRYLVIEDDWSGSFGGISSLNEFLTSQSTDIEMLTEAFCTCWERAGIPMMEKRIAYAKQVYQFILENAQDASINEWKTSTGYLTTAQSLNNAVLMYRFYSAGGGGGGKPTPHKSTIPVWMMCRHRRY